MTWRSGMTLSVSENGAFYAALAFLRDRLERQETLDWALGLKPTDKVNRLALLHLIDHPATALKEPWATAWRLVEEYWNEPLTQRHNGQAYLLEQRIQHGERTGALVSDIIELISPRLVLEPLGNRKPIRRPAKGEVPVGRMMHVSVTSNGLVKPADLGIDQVTEPVFLDHLARALDGTVNHSIALAERLGWIAEGSWWRLGEVRRIYAVGGDNDPDEYGEGIASAVKLLHAVVARLAIAAPLIAGRYVLGWEASDTPLHLRLWAAAAFDPTVVTGERVGARLLALDKRQFWNLHEFPEIAQLRALRFGDLADADQRAIVRRIIRRPPREQWGRHATDLERVDDARTYWAVRELRRIETAGGFLPDFAAKWLATHLPNYPDLVADLSPTEGFLDGVQVFSPSPNPDSRYDFLAGVERLRALETALSASRSHWDDDPSRRADDWISADDHVRLVLADFESDPANVGAFPKVWNKLGWTHTPSEAAVPGENRAQGQRVLRLLLLLPDKTITEAIGGLSWWLSRWEKTVVALDELEPAWFRIWPFAVAATNTQQKDEEEIDLNIVASSSDREPQDLDTLNSPVGHLVGVFFQVWSATPNGEPPFVEGKLARRMRDTIITATRRSGLIAKRRFIELLAIFMNADEEWVRAELLPPLLDNTNEALVLWRGVARRTLYRSTIELLGEDLIARVADSRLGRKTQNNLLFSIVVECLHALREQRPPAVPVARLQQLLRGLDDEVRATAANAVHRFVRDMSMKEGANDDPALKPDRLFNAAAKPFLETVWPQERSLATPGVSRALADLPAASGAAFAEAVETIDRFLVPFDCWSMIEFGLYGRADGEARLGVVNNAEKGRALLRLIDRSVGTTESAVVPHDLGVVLQHIRRVAPGTAKTPAFRRLAAAARL